MLSVYASFTIFGTITTTVGIIEGRGLSTTDLLAERKADREKE
jgi:hypothetical protein